MKPVRAMIGGFGAVTVWLAVGCGSKGPVEASVYLLQYRIKTIGSITFDSVRYDNGAGTMILVTSPDTNWVVTLTVPAGGTAEATAWGTGGVASSAKLKMTVTANAYFTESDSSQVNTNAPVKFTIAIPPRDI